MANLNETALFESVVYRVDKLDPVLGYDGALNNIANLQAQALANRTQWLKSRVDLGPRVTAFTDWAPPSSGALLMLNPTDLLGRHIRINVTNFDAEVSLPDANALADGANVAISLDAGANHQFLSTNGKVVNLQPQPGQKIINLRTGEELDEIFITPYTVAHIHKYSATRYIYYTSQRVEDMPAGMIAAWAVNSPPYGWVECNGASLSRAAYAALFANIGLTFGNPGASLFKVPDLRGEFIRGWDNARGVDTSRVFGSAQAEAINTAGVQLREASTTFAATGSGVGSSVAYFENSSIPAYGSNMALMGGTETRPRNVAMMYCIKY